MYIELWQLSVLVLLGSLLGFMLSVEVIDRKNRTIIEFGKELISLKRQRDKLANKIKSLEEKLNDFDEQVRPTDRNS